MDEYKTLQLVSNLRFMSISKNIVDKIPYLTRLVKYESTTYTTDTSIRLLEIEDEFIDEIKIVLNYIKGFRIPLVNDFPKEDILSYYGVYDYKNYDTIISSEMRDSHSELIKLPEYDIRKLIITRSLSPMKNLLFAERSGRYSIFETSGIYKDVDTVSEFGLSPEIFYDGINLQIDLLNMILDEFNGNIILAGGFIYTSLMHNNIDTSNINMEKLDIDLFLINCDQQMLDNIIEYITSIGEFNNSTFYRSKYALSITTSHGYMYQLILANSNSYESVLFSFDVDCACICYDGNNVYFSERAMYAVANGYNTIDKYSLSKSYANRLMKYSLRGMSVHVPKYEEYFTPRISFAKLLKSGDDKDLIKNLKYRHQRDRSEFDTLLRMERTGNIKYKYSKKSAYSSNDKHFTIKLRTLLSNNNEIILMNKYEHSDILDSTFGFENNKIVHYSGKHPYMPNDIYIYLSKIYEFEISQNPSLFVKSIPGRNMFDNIIYSETDWYGSERVDIFDRIDLDIKDLGFSVLAKYNPITGREQ